ncbi:MAG: hypothetical protein AAF203_05360, partial [Pseudomonadota bacterium]
SMFRRIFFGISLFFFSVTVVAGPEASGENLGTPTVMEIKFSVNENDCIEAKIGGNFGVHCAVSFEKPFPATALGDLVAEEKFSIEYKGKTIKFILNVAHDYYVISARGQNEPRVLDIFRQTPAPHLTILKKAIEKMAGDHTYRYFGLEQ